MSTEKVTFEIDPKHALVKHIEDLQRALTKRNQTIAELEARLEADGESKAIVAARNAGFREGWKACAGGLTNEAREVIRALEDYRSKGFERYLRPEERES